MPAATVILANSQNAKDFWLNPIQETKIGVYSLVYWLANKDRIHQLLSETVMDSLSTNSYHIQ